MLFDPFGNMAASPVNDFLFRGPQAPPNADVHAVLPPHVPMRVVTAITMLRLLNENRSTGSPCDGVAPGQRSLTNEERATYDAALQVIRYYLTGEQSFDEKPQTVHVVVPR